VVQLRDLKKSTQSEVAIDRAGAAIADQAES